MQLRNSPYRWYKFWGKVNSSHHWGRCFEAMGHTVKLLPAQHVAPLGHKAFCVLLRELRQPGGRALSPLLKTRINQIADEYYGLTDRIQELTDTLATLAATNPLCQLLMTIPGVGVINGARAALFRCKQKTDRLSRWVNQLVARRGVQKACVALASRLARIAWVLLNRNEAYKA